MYNAIDYCENEIRQHLHTQDCGELFDLNKKFDLVLCIEVAEHILPEQSENLIKNVANHSNGYIIFSAAPPGQRGTGHINCKEKDYWVSLANKYNLVEDTDITKLLQSYKLIKNTIVFK